MPRKHMNGVRIPFKVTLKDRHGKTYEAWRIEIQEGYYPNGKPKRKTFTAKKKTDCMKKAQAYENEVMQYGSALNRKVTLGQQIDLWLSMKEKTVDPVTVQTYMSGIKLLSPLLHRLVADLTPSLIEQTLSSLTVQVKGVVKPASKNTRSICKVIVKGALDLAVRDGVITHNPATSVSLGVVKHGDNSVANVFTVDEMQRMTQTALAWNNATGVRMLFRLFTGMRQGEILGARVEDLKLFETETTSFEDVQEEQTVTVYDSEGVPHTGSAMVNVRKPIQRRVLIGQYTVNWQAHTAYPKHGCKQLPNGRWECGNKYPAKCPQRVFNFPVGFQYIPLEGSRILCEPKSNTGRVVPIIPQLAMILQRHVESLHGVDNPFGLLFPNEHGLPVGSDSDTSDFKRLMSESGIDTSLHRGHETRHAVVSLLASMGVDEQLIQEIVGHSSAAMTRHYRHVNDGERLKAMMVLEEGLHLPELLSSGSGE